MDFENYTFGGIEKVLLALLFVFYTYIFIHIMLIPFATTPTQYEMSENEKIRKDYVFLNFWASAWCTYKVSIAALKHLLTNSCSWPNIYVTILQCFCLIVFQIIRYLYTITSTPGFTFVWMLYMKLFPFRYRLLNTDQWKPSYVSTIDLLPLSCCIAMNIWIWEFKILIGQRLPTI